MPNIVISVADAFAQFDEVRRTYNQLRIECEAADPQRAIPRSTTRSLRSLCHADTCSEGSLAGIKGLGPQKPVRRTCIEGAAGSAQEGGEYRDRETAPDAMTGCSLSHGVST